MGFRVWGLRWGLEFGGFGGVQGWGSIGLKVQGLD